MKKSKSAGKAKSKKQGNIFDVFVKEMFCRIYIFADFLLHYANPTFVEGIDLSTLELTNTHFFDKAGNEKIADLVFQCKRKNSDEKAMVVIVFEHYSNNLNLLPLKLLNYVLGFWNEFTANNPGSKLPAPYFIVLRTGKRPLYCKKMFRDIVAKAPGCEDSIPNFSYTIVDLPAIPFEKIAGGPSLLVVLGLLKRLTEGFEEDFDDALVVATQIEDSAQCDELLRRSFLLAAKVFATKEKKFGREQVARALHKVYKGREEKMKLTIFDELIAEGEAKGRVEGEARGEARGKAEGLKKAIIHVLKSRFPALTVGVEKKLSKITDIEQLTVLLERALYCESIKAFADSLNPLSKVSNQ